MLIPISSSAELDGVTVEQHRSLTVLLFGASEHCIVLYDTIEHSAHAAIAARRAKRVFEHFGIGDIGGAITCIEGGDMNLPLDDVNENAPAVLLFATTAIDKMRRVGFGGAEQPLKTALESVVTKAHFTQEAFADTRKRFAKQLFSLSNAYFAGRQARRVERKRKAEPFKQSFVDVSDDGASSSAAGNAASPPKKRKCAGARCMCFEADSTGEPKCLCGLGWTTEYE